MADGEIHYARFPIDLDSNGEIEFTIATHIATIFPQADYDIVDSEIVPISGSKGITNAVMVVIARRTT